MAVKIADTLKALSNTFPVAECVDIDVNINGTTKRLQKAIDDGEIGGGSDSTWKGTHEEWEALSTEEKGKYEVICFTDDYDESGICGSDSTWKGTHEEWEALSTEEKGKYEVVYFTDDYDESGIGGSDSIWKGTRDEWEALSTTDKQKYEIVCFTNDYNDSGIGESDSIWKGIRDEWEALSTTDKEKYEIVCFTNDYDGANSTGLIDDTNTSVKTTYSSSKIENSLSKKANTTDLTVHTSDTNIHVTTSDKTKWNNSVNKTDIVDNLTSTNTDKPLSANQGKILKGEVGLKANATDLTAHTGNTDIHVTTSDKTKWNKVDNKIDKIDIIDNLTSTNTDKPLSAKQGKALKDEIGLKANTTDLTSHTSNTGIHITPSERTKWNDVDNKVNKTDITTSIDISSTDAQVPSAKAVYDKILDSKKVIAKGFSDINNADFIECLNSLTLEGDKIYSLGFDKSCTNLPYKAWWEVIITGCFTEKMCIAKNTWKNEYYLGDLILDGGALSLRGGWQKICTTMVADVPYTKITTYYDTTNTVAGTGLIEYCVKNGICYVNISGIQVPSSYIPNTTIILSTELPQSKVIQRNNSIDGSYTYNGGVVISDKLMAVMTISGTYIHSSLSYPVVEP